MGEWIEHDGKGCPVAGNTIVQTRLQLFPKLIGDPVFADACSGWLHQPGEGLYISHYRIVGPQQEQAHMMAAPANLSGQGMLDNSIIAERDALRADLANKTASFECAMKQIAEAHDLAGRAIAARDSLRAEVERLTATNNRYAGWIKEVVERAEMAARRFALRWPFGGKHIMDVMSDEIERLRKGRDDVRRNEVGSDSVGSNIRSGSGRTCGSLLMETGPGNLDPRLGMPQSEGEPVGPRPMRRWVPIL